MFSSADLIQALLRRTRGSIRPPSAAGEFPTGWAAWFASMRERVGAITGATSNAIVAIMLAREPALSPGVARALNRWQSFTTLWRQQWHPASRDERGMRVLAVVITAIIHLFLAIFFAYVAWVRLMGLQPVPEGEVVTQVEYIGEGTPEETGGGPAQGEAENAAATAGAEPAASQQQAAQSSASQPTPPKATAEPAAQPQSATAPPVEQPLEVTQVPAPDQSFVLPPARRLDIPQPRVEIPDLSAPAPEVKVVEVPTPTPVQASVIRPVQPRNVMPREIQVPQIARQPEVVVREIPMPLPQVRPAEIPAQAAPAPEWHATAPAVVQRAIPTRSGTPAQAQANATGSQSAPGTVRAEDARPAGGAPTPGSRGARTATTASGNGTSSSPRPGALSSTRRGDDWGVSDRNRPGGQAGGLFNADGSPKLAGDGKVGGGLPPGTITEDFAKIDRHGTWLKRPPFDYTPTEFDRFWIPSETLLDEWVRKNIREVYIPLPGTGKKLRCVVSLLQLGGGCGIMDPNLQDVEATARKPPDAPFKRELQEDQESLAKPEVTP